MMKFFNYSKRYAGLRVNTTLTRNEEIKELWGKIVEKSKEFDAKVKLSYEYSYYLYRFNLKFAKIIKTLN